MLSVVNSTKNSWNEFEFSKFQTKLGETAATIASSQENGRVSRKKLVDIFLKFRNSVPEEVKKAAAPVLKCFQSEVDVLTARSQKAEEAFIQVYQKLGEMPDPSLALSEAETMNKKAKYAADLTAENAKLRETVEEMKLELVAAKSLETQLKRTQSKASELEKSNDRALENYQKKLQEQLELKEKEVAVVVMDANLRTSGAEAHAQSLNEALHAAQSQVFDLQTRLETFQAGKSREFEILVADLEKAHERIAVLQNESHTSGSSETTDKMFHSESSTAEVVQLMNRVEDLESELEHKALEVDKLVHELHSIETELREEKTSSADQLTNTTAELHAANESISRLQAKLAAMQDYGEMKKELEVLRSIEFPCKPGEQASEPLEFRLRRKNEQLQNRIASMSAEKDQIELELTQLRESVAASSERELQQAALISRLEEDLNQASSWRQDQGTLSPAKQGGRLSDLSDLLAAPEEEDRVHRKSSESAGILPIVQGQRDRLREQNRQLEENLLALRQQVVAVQTELESVRRDNVNLYEKIKFVQSYSPPTYPTTKPHRTETSITLPASPTLGTRAPKEDQLLARYSEAYAARLNPFEQFGRDERQRRYRDLQPHEKLMLTLGRLVMNNGRARLFTFAYIFGLHLLVFLVLCKLATSSEPLCPTSAVDRGNAANPFH